MATSACGGPACVSHVLGVGVLADWSPASVSQAWETVVHTKGSAGQCRAVQLTLQGSAREAREGFPEEGKLPLEPGRRR